ncbi:dTDP-4-dehydrorhamnose reductase [Verrucomicrobiota bacterium sgz303538]
MARTIIVGSGGRLGSALLREWSNVGEEVLGFNHHQLDLADDSALRSTLEPLSFDVLVNCAALTNVDYCETHEAEAYRLNAEAVRTLAQICSAKGARCIHISTDYVFDGAKQTPYTEEDAAEPISIYGASKRAGEVALLETSDKHLAVRVAWVFGPDRPSFVDQVLQRAREQERVDAISDKWSVPTYTLDAAELLRPFLRAVPEGGLLHLSNSGECTWQEYGQFALSCATEMGVPLKAREVGPLRMADLKAFVAKRPPYTVLSTEKLTRLTGREPRSWQQAVADHVQQSFQTAVPAKV